MLKEFSWSNGTTLYIFYSKEAILEKGKIPDNQYKVGQRFFEIKVRSVLQGNSNFMNKVEVKSSNKWGYLGRFESNFPNF